MGSRKIIGSFREGCLRLRIEFVGWNKPWDLRILVSINSFICHKFDIVWKGDKILTVSLIDLY